MLIDIGVHSESKPLNGTHPLTNPTNFFYKDARTTTARDSKDVNVA